MRQIGRIGSLLLMLAAAGCRQPTVTDAGAAEELRRTAFFSEVTTTRLALFRNHIFPAADLQREHRELAIFKSLGLIEIQPAYVLRGRRLGAQVVLTPTGEQAVSTGWRRTVGPGGEDAWLVPMARKELLTVTIRNKQADEAECAFSWKWVPTDVGKAFGAPATRHTGRAKLRRIGDSWSVESVLAD